MNDYDDPAFSDIVGDLLADGMGREQAEDLANQQIAENAASERRWRGRLRLGACCYCNEPIEQAFTCAVCRESICANCGTPHDGRWYCPKHKE